MADNSEIAVQNRTAVETPATPAVFRLAEIPLILFNEVSARLGIDEEFQFDGFRCRKLDKNSKHAGFEGAIGLRTWDEFNRTFVIWGCVPLPEHKDTIAEPVHLVSIHAWPADTGTWAYGNGSFMRDTIKAELQYNGYSLHEPAAMLIGLCFLRAAQLTRDPSCQQRQFWDQSTAFADGY
jgi:hypothetical protein